VRGSGFDIHREILDAVVADHFRLADLFQPRGSGFQNSAGVNRNRVPNSALIDKGERMPVLPQNVARCFT
jgi:hypothetical protein